MSIYNNNLKSDGMLCVEACCPPMEEMARYWLKIKNGRVMLPYRTKGFNDDFREHELRCCPFCSRSLEYVEDRLPGDYMVYQGWKLPIEQLKEIFGSDFIDD